MFRKKAELVDASSPFDAGWHIDDPVYHEGRKAALGGLNGIKLDLPERPPDPAPRTFVVMLSSGADVRVRATYVVESDSDASYLLQLEEDCYGLRLRVKPNSVFNPAVTIDWQGREPSVRTVAVFPMDSVLSILEADGGPTP